MSTIWHIALEPIETRYTSQWLRVIPELIEEAGGTVRTILGQTASGKVSEGAFLDFASTNMWKNEQLNEVSKLIKSGDVKDGDHFLFTDAWNPAIIQLKYMVGLLGLDVKIHGMWHAGSYDPEDFLGRAFPHFKEKSVDTSSSASRYHNRELHDNAQRSWAGYTEQALWEAIDYNYFATEYHYRLFSQSIMHPYAWNGQGAHMDDKAIISGQPHREIVEALTPLLGTPKEDIILFPHRIAPEKQVDLFKEIGKLMPTYKFIVCQEEELTKDEYHALLAKAKVVFSANLQETLGISCMEGVLAGAVPFVPNRLSYSEMYYDVFMYDSKLTDRGINPIQAAYGVKHHLTKLLKKIDAGELEGPLNNQRDRLIESYLHCAPMLNHLLGNA